MFKEYTDFYLQKVESLKKTELVYSINANGKIIGTLPETKNSSKKNGKGFFCVLAWIRNLIMMIREEVAASSL